MADNYWIKRERDHIEKSIKDDRVIAKKIKENYKRTVDEIEKEVYAFYTRYADKEGISMADAIKRVKASDTKTFATKAKRYVETLDFSPKASQELKLYNLTMKVNRLEMLKSNIGLELVAMSNNEEKIVRTALEQQAYDEFERQAGILSESVINNEKIAKNIVNSSFHNATFSERIWSNHDALKSELDKLLSRGITQGRNPREVSRGLRKAFDVSVYQAERLMITEMARVQTSVQETAFKEYGYKEFTYIAESTACKICKPLDGKVFKVENMQPGVNASPMHSNCKCSQAAYMSRKEWDKNLKGRGL